MPGTLQELRVLALLDRARGLNPLDRLTNPSGNATEDGYRGGENDGGENDGGENAGDEDGGEGHGGDEDGGEGPGGPGGGSGPGGGPGGPGVVAPFPALINLLVPAGNLFGWPDTAGEAGNWGLLDPADTRALAHAASRHPRTRWCVTVTGTDGTAVAHGCARGQHPWTPPDRDGPAPDEYQRAQLAGLLRALSVTLTPIAKGTCDHSQREHRYTPSRALRHMVRARNAQCVAPGCGTHAADCDLDHTLAYPAGPTCPCNLSNPCRHHHRAKQAPGWRLEQPEPGHMRWTAPSGRVYTTTPTVYDT
jgi:hypothetical protein